MFTPADAGAAEARPFPGGGYSKPRSANLPAASTCQQQTAGKPGPVLPGRPGLPGFHPPQCPQIAQPGPILDRAGKTLGEHNGLAYYTIGQRKDWASLQRAVIRAGEDASTNALVVASKRNLDRRS